MINNTPSAIVAGAGATPDICSMVIAMCHPYSTTVVKSPIASTRKTFDLASLPTLHART
jgi:hypothetical protein